MGRGQGPTSALISAGALLLCGAATPIAMPLREARWLQAQDLAADFSQQPAECRSAYADPLLERSAEIGRIVFRSPLLLGGQAARVGLSCSSCHRNGRNNPDFHFPGLSAAPGTADVTASLMSSHRGDGIFNPKPIPDLAGDPAKLKVSRDPRKNDLRQFIHGLVTQEFDGPEPPAAVLDGLAAYVRSLTPAECKGDRSQAIRLAPMLDDVAIAVRLAEDSVASGDIATARVLISAARAALGSIDERFQTPGGEPSRLVLREADADLKSIELADTVSPVMFEDWQGKWTRRVRQLRAAEPLSLYSKPVLLRALRG